MNDYEKLLKLQARRAKLKAELDALDDEIRALAEPMRAALKLPNRPVGRPRGSDLYDRAVTFLREKGPATVGELAKHLDLKRVTAYKLVDRMKVKCIIRANESGRYELAPRYEPGSEEEGTPAAPEAAK